MSDPRDYAESCPACEKSSLVEFRPALVAPFVSQRIWGIPTRSILLGDCGYCGLTFSWPRRTYLEESILYTGYRNGDYLCLRNSCEPWYTPRYHQSIQPHGWHLFTRAGRLRRIFSSRGVDLTKSRCLDYGGDKGWLVDACVGDGPGAKYVYDISGETLLLGVRLHELEDKRRYDVVLCTGLLEHVSYPIATLRDIASKGNPNALYYFEVPRSFPSKEVMRNRLWQLLLHRPLLFFRLLRPGLTHQISEHQSFFTYESLYQATTRAGLECLDAGEEGGVLWMLCERKPDRPAKKVKRGKK